MQLTKTKEERNIIVSFTIKLSLMKNSVTNYITRATERLIWNFDPVQPYHSFVFMNL